MTEQDLTTYFGSLIAPPKLLALLKFEREAAGGQYFSASFEFDLDPKKRALRTWSTAPSFLDSLWTFAQADGTGSLYAFWIPHGETDLDTVPVVAFGSEGGAHVVAQNFDALLQILAFDCEPMIDHREVYYYRGKDARTSAMSLAFRNWLKSTCGLDAVDDADTLVASAQAAYGERFREWMARFHPD